MPLGNQTLTPIQTWLTKVLFCLDNPGGGGSRNFNPPGGLLGSIQTLQSLTDEGLQRGYISTDATPANPPTDADFVAVGSPLNEKTFDMMVRTLIGLSVTIRTVNNGVSVQQILLQARG